MAQGVTLLATPLLTRLYGPAAIGEYFTVLAACLIVSSVATLRLDVAVQRSEAREVRAVAGTALLSGVVVSAVAGAVGALAQPLLPHVPGLGWLALAYCSVMAAQQVGTALLLRGERHAALSGNRVAVNGLIVLLQLVGAAAGPSALTLLLADVTGRLLALLFVLPAALGVAGPPDLNWRVCLNALRRERNLPRFAAPATLLNSATVYALPVTLALAYPAVLVGQVAMTQKLVSLPLAVVGQALGQVYLAGAIQHLGRTPAARYAHLLKFTKLLAGMALILLAVLPFAPTLFSTVLGPEWTEAGRYYQLLAVAYAAQFIVNPVSQTLNLHAAERLQFVWDAVRFTVVAVVLLGGPVLGLRITTVLGVYSAVMTVAYLVLLVLSARVTRHISGETP